ncbi:alpha/beta hydrolase [Paraburkholderia sp. CNPSo 3272]|nr:alpha/beta fold hydrolase [Paraburkholderia sp. CNPSo 3272]MCP3724331.1 alpha/beta hydrolase [Paraburkholderia sp. CNPSo 3272]
MGILATITMAAAIQSGIPSQTVRANIAAPGPAGPLQGTLLSPANQDVPVVLIVPGSGPTDRNGNGPNGLRASTYRLLAEGLLSHGIASIRIDKRGMYGSASAIPDADDVTLDDYAADVKSWVATIRKRAGVSCVWLLGHSEGGLVTLVAAQRMKDICGLILLSTAGRPLGEVLREQLRSNSANAPILDNAMKVLDALEAGQTVDATKIDRRLMPLFRPQVQRFLMSELAIDPATLLADYTKPVLIIQGLRDLQVSTHDAQRLKQAYPRAELVLIANANHVLKSVRTVDRNENLAAYSDPDLPLADHVVEAISTFVHNHAVSKP